MQLQEGIYGKSFIVEKRALNESVTCLKIVGDFSHFIKSTNELLNLLTDSSIKSSIAFG